MRNLARNVAFLVRATADARVNRGRLPRQEPAGLGLGQFRADKGDGLKGSPH